jgi:hypothetical protein
MNAFGLKISALSVAMCGLAVLVMLPPAASLYYEAGGGEGCARCHEIRPQYDAWRNSAHRGVPCRDCHGDALTLDIGFHLNNAHRVTAHLKDEVPEQVRMRGLDVARMAERCARCHRQEAADWKAGPHAATFSRLLLNQEHNRKRLLMDDCLRCHGAYFEGGIRDLVAPLDTKGPWRILRAEYANLPAIPCGACHQMHRTGAPLARAAEGAPAARQELHRPSLALFDRREMHHVANLPVPPMRSGGKPVRMSPDPRQGLCYQCHAPLASMEVGSGDDRTGVGVHEGISCVACHQKHGQTVRASCAECHPRLSNCGLDVEKMDTTFRDPKSPHNVHFVKCADCHSKGVPKKRVAGAAVARAED